jgi:hypothetical protein
MFSSLKGYIAALPFGGELSSVLCMPGWIFRGRATASATALFGPRPCSSFDQRSLRPSPCRLRSGLRPRMGCLSSSSTTSGEGGRPRHQVVAMGVAKISTRPVQYNLLRQGMGRAQSVIATMPQQRLRPSGGYVREDPGTVAMAARRIAATSAGGGRPSRQSRPDRRRLFSTFT